MSILDKDMSEYSDAFSGPFSQEAKKSITIFNLCVLAAVRITEPGGSRPDPKPGHRYATCCWQY
jgi:hypothetical protein